MLENADSESETEDSSVFCAVEAKILSWRAYRLAVGVCVCVWVGVSHQRLKS